MTSLYSSQTVHQPIRSLYLLAPSGLVFSPRAVSSKRLSQERKLPLPRLERLYSSLRMEPPDAKTTVTNFGRMNGRKNGKTEGHDKLLSSRQTQSKPLGALHSKKRPELIRRNDDRERAGGTMSVVNAAEERRREREKRT